MCRQPNLYPTVGLQTPGEVVDANFGQAPFVFDVEDMLRELRARTRLAIDEFPLPDAQGQWQQVLHRCADAAQVRGGAAVSGSERCAACRMVSSYLVHQGYCSTALAFSRATGQPIDEDIASIKNRQSERSLRIIRFIEGSGDEWAVRGLLRVQGYRSWCCRGASARRSRRRGAPTPTCWSATPTCSSCSRYASSSRWSTAPTLRYCDSGYYMACL